MKSAVDKLYTVLLGSFILLSLLLRLNYSLLDLPLMKIMVGLALLTGIGCIASEILIPVIMLSFCLLTIFFGYHNYSPRNQLFETLALAILGGLFTINSYRRRFPPSGSMVIPLLALYCILSILSLLLLPVRYIFDSLLQHGWSSFAASVFNDQPFSIFYPIAGVSRLVLFAALAIELTRLNDFKVYTKAFIGLSTGLILSMTLGFLNYFGIIEPFWLPSGWDILKNRLSFTFGNPGWFAEYATVVIPFVLMGFERKSRLFRAAIFFVLILTEVSLILTMSRAGWMTYPVVLISSWYLFYRYDSKKKKEVERQRLKRTAKIAISIPVTLIFSIYLAIHFPDLSTTSHSVTPGLTEADSSTYSQQLAERATDTNSARYQLWRTGLAMVKESPLIGLGYETFRWHLAIMQGITNSNVSRSLLAPLEIQDEPHNFYICLLIDGGILGLTLWLGISIYSFAVLFRGFLLHNDYRALCAALSLYSFHMYGFFQGMQYNPSIYIVAFLCFSYAIYLETNNGPLFSRHNRLIILSTSCLLIGLAAPLYLVFSDSAMFKNKYGLAEYGINPEDYKYPGFYSQEGSGPKAFRWSGKHGRIPIDSPGFYRISYRCDHPDVAHAPVSARLTMGGVMVDETHFVAPGEISKQIYLPVKSTPENLDVTVSRTWSPRSYNISMDHRQLGVGVRVEKLGSAEVAGLNDGYIGFYLEEQWPTPAWTHLKDPTIGVHWSGGSGTISVSKLCMTGCSLHLFCGHPDLKNRSATVTIAGLTNGTKIITFREAGWKELTLSPADLKGVDYLVVSLDRTWNPKALGISEDSRDLGVAINVTAP